MHLHGMKRHTVTIVLFMAAVLTGLVSARGAINLGGNGFRLRLQPVDPSGNSGTAFAAARCRVRINQQNVLLHWAATRFTHVEQPELSTDAFLRTTVTREHGRVRVSPAKAQDKTDIAAGDDQAAIVMGIRGDGDLDIRMEIGIDASRAAAGRHCADVVLTVTGH